MPSARILEHIKRYHNVLQRNEQGYMHIYSTRALNERGFQCPSWKLGDCRSIDWKTYQVICSSPEFFLGFGNYIWSRWKVGPPSVWPGFFRGNYHIWLHKITTLGQKLPRYHIFPKNGGERGVSKNFSGQIPVKTWPKPFFLNQICKI